MTTTKKTMTTHPPRRGLAIGVALTVVLLAGGCSASTPKKADAKSDIESTTVPESSNSSSSSTTSDSGSSGVTTTAARPADDNGVLGSSKGQQPADPNDETAVPLRLDVNSVKRLSGETIEVRFSITNVGTNATFEPWSQLGDPTMSGSNYDAGGFAVLDRPHDKKYLALYDTNQVCLCSDGLNDVAVAPGKSVSLYADVTAPPTSVTTVDVSLPGFAPISGLQIR